MIKSTTGGFLGGTQLSSFPGKSLTESNPQGGKLFSRSVKTEPPKKTIHPVGEFYPRGSEKTTLPVKTPKGEKVFHRETPPVGKRAHPGGLVLKGSKKLVPPGGDHQGQGRNKVK